MGGGVAIGDINNDGLSDVFFTGNMVGNKMYLNQEGLTFEDISESANLTGDSRWYTGVTMIDINADGFLDIYLSVSGRYNTKNQLFINNGDLSFSEKAEQFGIADASSSIQSTFLDYDRDGDLDLIVCNYPQVPLTKGNEFYFRMMRENKHEYSAHLYKNNGDKTFTDVTQESGVQNFGLTLGIVASDFNNDGWVDLYLSNDFQIPDYLYLNNGDGTFSEHLKNSMEHTSMFGMGIDAADFTNDGLIDLIQLDMAPEDYRRAKINMASMNPANFQEIVDLGGHYQYMQNCVQVNRGFKTNGLPVFSEISRLSGLSLTDWSWGVLIADLNNNGNKDVIVTNGMRRDVNNNDVVNSRVSSFNPDQIKLEDLPSEPIDNYVFENRGTYQFKNVSNSSGLNFKGYSNGLAYGDLDNDGDLDVVINNLDATSMVFENHTNDANNHIKIVLKGSEQNVFGIGARIVVKIENQVLTQELTLSRGFQSSVDPVVHFGLGEAQSILEIQVLWPDGSVQLLKDVDINQTLTVEKKIDLNETDTKKFTDSSGYRFIDITEKSGIEFYHKEDKFDDFQNEPLLPHKNSTVGPCLAVGDVNNDGLDDFFIGNAAGSAATMFLQKEDMTFDQLPGPWDEDNDFEDTGALLFDADGDNDLDLYVVSGGNDPSNNKEFYQDRLYVNVDGRFIKSINAIPEVTGSGQVVIASDIDNDGDQDLFVGGRIIPGRYPYPASSYIFRNEGGTDNSILFRDVTKTVAGDLLNCGLVTCAIWEDFNGDGRDDLILAGEWMPIRFFENRLKGFTEVTDKKIDGKTAGWWYALRSFDVDGDGDKDLVGGNLGLNYKYKTSSDKPFEVYANDFDENGKSDIVLSKTKKGKKLPVRGRECSAQQVPAINYRFKTYQSFAEADLTDIYGEYPLKRSLNYQADRFAHCWFEKTESGDYKIHQLPEESQFSSINTIEVVDADGDIFPDLLMAGNLYGSEIETPRNDAGIGVLLQGTSASGFKAQNPIENGFIIRGEVKKIQQIKLGSESRQGYLIAVNDDLLKLFEYSQMGK